MSRIVPVQASPVFAPMFKGTSDITAKKPNKKVSAKTYVDSTINNAIQSTPMLLSLTGIMSLFDYGKGKATLPKALTNNLTKFFVPVLIGSSLLLAALETINLTKKPNKKMEKTVV